MDLFFQYSGDEGGGDAFQNGQKHWKGLRCRKNFETIQRDQCAQNCVVLCLLHRDLLQYWNKNWIIYFEKSLQNELNVCWSCHVFFLQEGLSKMWFFGQEITQRQAVDNTVLDTLIPLNCLEVFLAPETLSMLLTISIGGDGDAFQNGQKHW